MNRKKLGKALLFPHPAVMVALLPVATVFLAYSMLALGSDSALSIASYVLAAYTLTVWCFRIPRLIGFCKTFKNENKYARRWLDDERLRVNVSLYGSLVWNLAYAIFQLWLGFYHKTFWYASLAGYYFLLAVMRFFLVRYTANHRAGERMRDELKKYRACGWVLLVMNLSLSMIVFFMVYWNRTFVHHEITTIAMAAYTFTALTVAIVQLVQYRKYNSPVYSASKAIALAAACVSMLTLESTMLTTWGGEDPIFRRIMVASTGAVVSLLIIAMAVYMIAHGSREIQKMNEQNTEKSHGKQQ